MASLFKRSLSKGSAKDGKSDRGSTDTWTSDAPTESDVGNLDDLVGGMSVEGGAAEEGRGSSAIGSGGDAAGVPDMAWGPTDASGFVVRVGPNYKKNRKKAPSAPSLYEVLSVKMMSSPALVDNPTEAANTEGMPELPAPVETTHFEHVPRYLVVAWNLPTGAPSMMNAPSSAAEVCVVYTFGITAETAGALADLESASPAIKLWETYCREASDENSEMKGRFKAITTIVNFSEVNVPSMLSGYNSKPVLIKKTGSLTRRGDVLEMNVNVHTWPFTTRKGFNVLIPTFPTMILDSAFVIEGRDDDEVPEQVVGCARLSNPSLEAALPVAS